MLLNNWSNFPSFEEFLDIPGSGSYKTVNLGARAAGSQYSWIDEPIDLIIKLEDLDTGLQPIKNMFETSRPVIRENASVRSRDYRQYYNAHTRNLVAQNFREDIEQFGYEF
jgi:hypothetical protein